ncbi:MAG: M14 family zinc carboxypeptidase [bacterium]|nr:M14 family zinc carboxypeptidase [bacterium]
MNKIIIALAVIMIAGLGVYFINKSPTKVVNPPESQNTTATTTPIAKEENPSESIIGKSVENRDIIAYHYGTGETELLFIGGIHGGYSWNTALVAFELMDYLKASPNIIPKNIKVTVIPVLNPDGLNKVVGTAGRFTPSDVPSPISATVAGRFNANTVDLNRNFDCDWKASGTWQSKTVSGGSRAFSEPETRAIKSYVELNKPDAVVTWYSAAGGVYASECGKGISAETRAITKEFADTSGYPAFDDFDFYEVTGDMVNWFAKNNIPAISVLLTNHTDTEWTKNQKGIQALLKYYVK